MEGQMKSKKAGFGLMEVVASMAILGIMFTAVLYLQYWNRYAAVRIQMRNDATQIAQQVVDSLGALGIASVQNISNMQVQGNDRFMATGTNVRAIYTVNVLVDEGVNNAVLSSSEGHIWAKKLNVRVGWTLRNTPFEIQYSTVVE